MFIPLPNLTLNWEELAGNVCARAHATNLKKAKLVWRIGGTNDDGLHVANINITTCDSQGYTEGSQYGDLGMA